MEPRRIDTGTLLWGVLLLLAGTLLTLARFDLLDLARLWPWWPLGLVVAGLVVAVTKKRPKCLRDGLWLIGIGLWLLLNTFGLAGFHWGSSWPLLVIFAGLVQMAIPKAGEPRSDGLTPLLIGLWLLVNTRHLFGLDWQRSWPLLLVAVGLGMMVRAVLQARRAERTEGAP
ncbi:MAG TPA: DUF5668 domain-containing protein [Thermoanaerobaculia bacterium]|nr:DUF5668 domain-containing protein [Thermoanaerobaculia bacterium]